MLDTKYEDLLANILYNGIEKNDRTGTGTVSLFACQLRYNLAKAFPLITTKRVFFRGVVGELLWFLSGNTNVRALQNQGIHIWDEWADKNGDLGRVYGAQWRDWVSKDGKHIDQIQTLISTLKTSPDSRRMVVSAWNVGELNEMALMPCHSFFQCYVAQGKLSLQVYQRSADMFLGVPFNIASYALLTHMLADQAGLEVGELIWTGGDCHIYTNHAHQVKLQLSRDAYEFPTVQLVHKPSINDYTMSDISLINYQSHNAIKAPVAV